MPIQLTELALPVAIVVVFWLLVIRPQQTRARQQREMLGRLKVGDEVMTLSGMFGTVVETGDRIRLRTVSGADFEMLPGAISRIMQSATTDVTARHAEAVGQAVGDAPEAHDLQKETND